MDDRVNSTKTPTPIELLTDALTAMMNGGGNIDFLHKITKVLMRQAFDDNPEVVALSNGKSIMAACARVDINLCMEWWKIRKGGAWAPTKKTPFPLISFINPSEDFDTKFYINLLNMGAPKPLVNLFWEDALRHAMPVSTEQASQWEHLNSLKGEQLERLDAQKTVLEFCFSNRDGLANLKMKAFLDHGGVITTSHNHYMDDIDFIENKHLNPHIKVFDDHFGLSENTSRWRSWAEAWELKGNYSNAFAVLPYLKRHKVNTDNVEALVFIEETRKIATHYHNKLGTGGKAWTEISALFQQNKSGWDVLDEEGALLWQSLLIQNGSLLPAMIKSPPPCGLTAKSPDGRGIWELVIQSLNSHSGIREENLSALARKVPVEGAFTHPLLLSWWGQKESPHDALLSITGKDHSHLWFGEDQNQNKVAISLLAGFCDRNMQSQAYRKIEALLSPDMNLSDVSGNLRLAACVLQEIIQDQKDLAKRFPTIQRALISPPTRIGKHFMRDLQKQIEKIEPGDYEAPLANLILSIAQSHALTLSTPKPPATSKAPRRRL